MVFINPYGVLQARRNKGVGGGGLGGGLSGAPSPNNFEKYTG